jgi:hypothetical protein
MFFLTWVLQREAEFKLAGDQIKMAVRICSQTNYAVRKLPAGRSQPWCSSGLLEDIPDGWNVLVQYQILISYHA